MAQPESSLFFDFQLTMWSHLAITRLDPLMAKAFELVEETSKTGNHSDKAVEQIVLTFVRKAMKFKGRRMAKVRLCRF